MKAAPCTETGSRGLGSHDDPRGVGDCGTVCTATLARSRTRGVLPWGTGIRLLGDVAVVHHTEVRRPSTQRPRIVLALLALHAGNSVNTDLLIDETWGEELPANPRVGRGR